MTPAQQLSKVRDVVAKWRRDGSLYPALSMRLIEATLSAPEGEAAGAGEADETLHTTLEAIVYNLRHTKGSQWAADAIEGALLRFPAPPAPKASAQALTGDEIDDVWAGCSEANDTIDMHEYAEAIERAFCEKNAIPAPAQEGAA